MAADSTFVVGASQAGATAAETLRREGFDGRVVLMGTESQRPYERPSLSKDYLQGKSDPEKLFVHDADLGLGSNLGDRRGKLQAALEELARVGVDVVASSSTYDTAPVGDVLDQPDFLNACLFGRTAHGPEDLLDACKAVERTLGREPGLRHAPRVIDVDVLLMGDMTYRSRRLRLPHPEVSARRFVLVPLLELDPDLALPDGTACADALKALGDAQAVKHAGPPLL